MPRIVRAGLIQASVGTEAPQELDHLKKYMIDKHVSMIEQAAGEGVEVLQIRASQFLSCIHVVPTLALV